MSECRGMVCCSCMMLYRPYIFDLFYSVTHFIELGYVVFLWITTQENTEQLLSFERH